jgi:integrase
MAWLYKQTASDNWFIGQRVNGRMVRKTTGTSDRSQAEKQLARVEAMEQAVKADQLTEDFYKALTGSQIKAVGIRSAVEQWRKAKALSLAKKTAERYEDVLKQFTDYLKADVSLRSVTQADVTGFLNQQAKALSHGSLIVSRKILSGFWNWCITSAVPRLASENPVKGTTVPKARKHDQVRRRAFTTDEVKALWTNAPDDFWRYMLIGGFYTGVRLGDLICLAKGEVDLQANVLRLEANKTYGRKTAIEIPIADPLRAILGPLVKQCHGKYLWPEQAAYYLKEGPSPFSQDFYELVMVKAGLVPKRSHVASTKGNGRRRRHNVSEVTFHCLRHTFVSLLKTSGVSQSVAKALAGHASDRISDLYTHVAPEHMQQAIKQLPEISA